MTGYLAHSDTGDKAFCLTSPPDNICGLQHRFQHASHTGDLGLHGGLAQGTLGYVLIDDLVTASRPYCSDSGYRTGGPVLASL